MKTLLKAKLFLIVFSLNERNVYNAYAGIFKRTFKITLFLSSSLIFCGWKPNFQLPLQDVMIRLSHCHHSLNPFKKISILLKLSLFPSFLGVFALKVKQRYHHSFASHKPSEFVLLLVQLCLGRYNISWLRTCIERGISFTIMNNA